MNKQWLRNSHDNYTLWVDGKKIGNMVIKFSQISHRAACMIDGKDFEIKRVGHWKSNFGMYYSNTQGIFTAITDKWYTNTFNIAFNHREYKLIIRNNPLMEYVITENNQEILKYGLETENGKLKLMISTSDKSNHFFDFLLWFLFLPTVVENFGNNY